MNEHSQSSSSNPAPLKGDEGCFSIGRPVLRIEDERLLRGGSRYVSDLIATSTARCSYAGIHRIRANGFDWCPASCGRLETQPTSEDLPLTQLLLRACRPICSQPLVQMSRIRSILDLCWT